MDGVVNSMSKLKLSIEVTIEQDEDGFVAYSKDLKGVVVGGKTEREAMENYMEMSKFHIMCLIKTNRPIPTAITREKRHQGTNTKTLHPELQFA